MLPGSVFLLLVFQASTAQPAATSAPEQTTDETTDLIGTDLTGWIGSVDDWIVEDGVLIGRTDGSLKTNRFIWADIDPVGNFDLTVDVWVSKGGNSGIQYRSDLAPSFGPFSMTGYQCDVLGSTAKAMYNGMLYEEKGRRILAYSGEMTAVDTKGQPWVLANMTEHTFAPEQWLTYRVRVVGNHHRHWINGWPTADTIDMDQRNRRLTGKIGVQTHVGPAMEIRYRDMKLRRLPGDLPLLAVPIPEQAARVVPQGQPRRPRSKT